MKFKCFFYILNVSHVLNYIKSFYTCIIFAMRLKYLSCTYIHTHTHTHSFSLSVSGNPHFTGIKKDSPISVRNIRNIQIHTFQGPTKPSLTYIHTFTDGIQVPVFCLIIKGRNRCCRIKKCCIIIEINLLS